MPTATNTLSRLPGLSANEKGALANLCSANLCSSQGARLKLAFLKENTDYQKFYEAFRADPRSFLSLRPIPERDNPPRGTGKYPRFSRAPSEDETKDLKYYFREFGLNPNVEMVLWLIGWPFTAFLAAFDPENDESEIDLSFLEALPLFFGSPAIRRFQPGYTKKFFYDSPGDELGDGCRWTGLAPYEHILVVDLRKQRRQLEEEFKRFLDQREDEWKDIQQNGSLFEYSSTVTYRQWTPEGRERKEAERQLEIWKLRCKRLPFSKIGEQLKITEDLAKKGFYRAYELIYQQDYRKEIWKELIHERAMKKARIDGVYEDLLALEEVKQQHRTGLDESIQAPDDSMAGTCELMQDIERMCSKCQDTECYNRFCISRKNEDLESWHPDCPKLYKFLKS